MPITQYVKFWVEDGILYFVYNPSTFINLKIAKKIVEQRIAYQNEISYPILCDLRNLKAADKAARDYMAVEGTYMATAVALLIDQNYSERLSAQFMKTSSPTVPVQEFFSIKEAVAFLNKYKKKHFG